MVQVEEDIKLHKRTPTITRKEKEYALFYAHNYLRSKKAKDVDNGTNKGLTDNFSKMWTDPSRNDWAGIDTVIRHEPMGFSKKKGKDAYAQIVDVFGESGFK